MALTLFCGALMSLSAADRAAADVAAAWRFLDVSDEGKVFGGGGGGGGSWSSEGGGGRSSFVACVHLASSAGGWRQLAVAASVFVFFSIWYVYAAVGRRRALAAAVTAPLVSPGASVAAALFGTHHATPSRS